MEFRILGPLEVVTGGQALDLGGAKQRALLAVLLLHANRVVSTDRLIDALWEDDPPESAHKALQVYVSGVRKLLGKERVQTRPPGYVLRVHEGEFDLDRFRALQAEGMPAEALSLWRGPPLADFAYERFAQPAIARLEELVLTCVEERIEQDLRAGRHAACVGELEALVKEHPLRESLRAELMLALYRCGRQADALDAYQQARGALVGELGIEPGRALRELHQAILRQDPELDAAPAAEEREAQPAPELVEAPPNRESTPRETRKTVTVLCAGVGALREDGERLDPEQLRRVVAQSFAEVQTAAERHGGSLEAVSGEAITVVFGLPQVHEDDALRAVRAAADLRERLAELAVELSRGQRISLAFTLGVSTGEIVAGGGLQPLGVPLTDAQRLAQQADRGDVLLDGSTHLLLRDAVVVEPADGALRLVEIGAGRAGPARHFRSPMVGRGRESRRLQHAFEQSVTDGACQLFTVLGAAGVGKSRLVQEFLAQISEHASVAQGRCLPYGEGITYWPLLEAVKEVVGIDDANSPDQGRAKLASALAVEEDAERTAQRVAETIGLTEAATGIEEGFAAVRALFEALARQRPLVIVFDDVHWGESVFLDLIEYLADWARDVPMLLICLARPDLLDVRPAWGGGKLNSTSILLEPLSEAESLELIGNLTSAALADETRKRIVAASEGNPLFVEEMLAVALEDDPADGRLVVPPTIQALIAARLDRLEEDERALVEVGAVQGKVFYENAAAALLHGDAAEQVRSLLGSLLHKELVRPDRTALGGRAYRFRHQLIRDAAYDSIPKEARAELHEHFGRWLETAVGERAAEYEEIVGYHLEQAYRYRAELGAAGDSTRAIAREAAERLAAAGRRAFVRGDAPAGVNLSSRAAALLLPEDPLRVELVPNVRVIQGLVEDMSWAEQVLTEAVEAAATNGDRRLAAQALVQRGFLRLFTEPDVTPEELIQTAGRAADLFDELADELGLARSWRLVAQAHYLARHAGPSEEAAERARAHARRAADQFEERETIQWLSVVLFLGPKPAQEAAAVCRRLLDEISGQPALEVHVLGALSYLEAIRGRPEEAEGLAERADQVMQALGEGWLFPAFAGLEASWVHDPVEAERKLRHGYEMLSRAGERSHFCTVASLLARIAYGRREYEQAGELTREAEEAAAANDVHCQIHWRATRAKVIARQGHLESAEQLAREAVAFAAPSDFLCSHGDALADLAEVLVLAGRAREAIDPLCEAIALYGRKGNVLAAGATRGRLAELERASVT